MVGTISLPTPVFSITWQEQIEQKMLTLKESEEHWIEIDLTRQRLIAWEGKRQVHAVIISTGKKNTPTPPGIFKIKSKHRQGRMQGADYDILDVPYIMYYNGGYAIHGAYWHKSFGTPVSHGCTNVALDHAEWFFNWTSVGTPVIIHH
jgi:lipoprotein-anchoring transpeptidase ErfK/SrfK